MPSTSIGGRRASRAEPAMIWPMDLSTMLLPIINEALRDWGLWALIPMIFGLIAYETHRKFLAKDMELAALRREVADLQEKRLQDAREMIRIAESGTQATASRTHSDERFADMLEAVLRRNARPGLLGWRR